LGVKSGGKGTGLYYIENKPKKMRKFRLEKKTETVGKVAIHQGRRRNDVVVLLRKNSQLK